MQNNTNLISRGGENKTWHAARVFRKRTPGLMNEVTSKKSAAHPAGGPPAPCPSLRTAQRSLPQPSPREQRPGPGPGPVTSRHDQRRPRPHSAAGPTEKTGERDRRGDRTTPTASPRARPRGAHRGNPRRGRSGTSRRAAASTGRAPPGRAARRRPPPSWPPRGRGDGAAPREVAAHAHGREGAGRALS